MDNNICLLTDSYKLCHWNMYPEGTEKVYSYFESRKGATFNKTVFFGLQYILQKYLTGQVVTKEKIDAAEDLVNAHMGPGKFNRAGWQLILDKWDGRLPLEINAVPEGTPVPTGNVMMTVVNLEPQCPWLTNYVETLLTQVWYPSTVATLSREIKLMLENYAVKTCEGIDHVAFQLHDFGYRGATSVESAGLGGAGHLINFSGTDTIRAIELINKYYHSQAQAYSVPATEHSIMTSLGRNGEKQVMAKLLKDYPTGILSVVIDSYNYREFIKMCAEEFSKEILNRDGKVVFRPDSGDPTSVSLEVVEMLGAVFGYIKNELGYRVLHPKVGALWGDGIDYQGIRNILFNLKNTGWASSNMVFGMGGGLLQKVNRDTQRFAFKCSAQCRNGVWYDIFKDPLDSSKRSKTGSLALIYWNGEYSTVTLDEHSRHMDCLKTVFLKGNLLHQTDFASVKQRALTRLNIE